MVALSGAKAVKQELRRHKQGIPNEVEQNTWSNKKYKRKKCLKIMSANRFNSFHFIQILTDILQNFFIPILASLVGLLIMLYISTKVNSLRLRTLIMVLIVILIVACLIFWFVHIMDDPNSHRIVGPTDDSNPCDDGHCCLTLVESIDKILFYKHYDTAINHYGKGEFHEARDEFRQALILDRNYPGLNQWIADSSLKLKEYDEVEGALKKEIALLDCLDLMTDDELFKYATIKGINEINVHELIVKGRAEALYNLACFYSAKNERQLALDALQEAIHSGFKEEDLTCPELDFMHN